MGFFALQVVVWPGFQFQPAPLCSMQLLVTSLMCYLFALLNASAELLYKMESNGNPCGSTLTNAFLAQNSAVQRCSLLIISS